MSTTPSTTISDPAPASSTSSSTTSPTATSRTSPSRTTRAFGAVSTREPVERALGPQLLHDADAGVRDQHEPEQGVLQRPDHEDDREHRAQDRVEPREDVRAHDLGDRARGCGGDVVDLALSDALGDLGGGEAPFGIDVRRLGGRGRRSCAPSVAGRTLEGCEGFLIAIAIVAAVWVVAIAALWIFGRKVAAKQLARAIPDLVALTRGLIGDPRVPLGLQGARRRGARCGWSRRSTWSRSSSRCWVRSTT